MTKKKSKVEIAGEWHLQHRKKDFRCHGAVIRGAAFRRLYHPLGYRLLRMTNKADGISVVVVGNKKKETQKPVIYACTHVGGHDIEAVFEAIKEQAWLFLGDPREIYLGIAGVFLFLSGTLFMDTKDKEDRKIAKAKAEQLLSMGENLLIFPEGAWNISENKLVYYLYYGTAMMAIKTGAEVVPVAMSRDNSTYYVNIGENMDVSAYSTEDREACTREIRDRMATLEWEIMEQLPLQKREQMSQNAYEEFIDSMFGISVAGSYHLKDVYEARFEPRDLVDPEDAFAFMANLSPSMLNAFLFKKENIIYSACVI